MFTEFQEVAKATLELMKLLKSQKKQSPEIFLDKLIDFLIKWQETFPDVPVFNKLHLMMTHYIEHVEMYEMIGRASGESHESVHAWLAELRKTCCNMPSYDQANETFWSVCRAILVHRQRRFVLLSTDA